MDISDKIKQLKQEIKIANTEGDMEKVNLLEDQIAQLREQLPHAMDDDPFFTDENMYCDD